MADRNNTANDDHQCLVCPLYRHNPMAHAGCAHLRLKRIKDVKEHLVNRHGLPLYCGNCGRRDFADLVSRDEHVDARQCSAPPGGVTIEGIDQRQRTLLAVRANRKQTPEEQWMEIWAICFPDVPKPNSPFMGDYIQETICMLVDYFEAEEGAVFGRASANEPHQQQMARRVIEGLLNGFLRQNAGVNGRNPPHPISLRGPNPNPGDPVATTPGALPAAAPGLRHTAAAFDPGLPMAVGQVSPNTLTTGDPGFHNTQAGMIGGVNVIPYDIPVDPELENFNSNPVNTDAAGPDTFMGHDGTVSPTEALMLQPVANWLDAHRSPSDYLPMPRGGLHEQHGSRGS